MMELQDIKNMLKIFSASVMPIDLLELYKRMSILPKEERELHSASCYHWIVYS